MTPKRPSIKLGPFSLLRPFAKGGQGEIWGAIHSQQKVRAAVKVMTQEAARHPVFLESFHNEVRAVAGLSHPGIVTVLDRGLIDKRCEEQSEGRLLAGSPYLIMEYASHGSLLALKGALPWWEIRDVLIILLDALAHAHAHRVLHRDLKLGNILICGAKDTRPGLKLTDFGIATPDPTLSREGTYERPMGTLAYMSPEQITGHWRDQGPWTDLYSLGCVAWRLITGGTPFGKYKGRQHVAAKLFKSPPKLAPRMRVPRQVDTWLRCLLQKEASDRFQCAADAAYALRQLPDLRNGEPSRLGQLLDLDAWVKRGDPLAGQTIQKPPATTSYPLSAPVPLSWTFRPDPLPLSLIGAGLDLFGMRPIPMVGREAERDLLWRDLLEVERTHKGLVRVLTGSAGVGKSFLGRWISLRADETGFVSPLFLNNYTEDAPGEGVRRLVERLFNTRGLTPTELEERLVNQLSQFGLNELDIEKELPAILGLFTHGKQGEALSLPSQRYGVVSRLLTLAFAGRPYLLRVEDVHFGLDSIGLVRYLLNQPIPIYCLLTVRDEALAWDPQVSQSLAELQRDERVHVLPIQPLQPAESRALIGHSLKLEDGLISRLEQRVHGNPQFAVQIIKDWIEQGVLRASPRGFRLKKDFDQRLPSSVATFWEQRLQAFVPSLSNADQLALKLLAVLGGDVFLREWKAILKSELQSDYDHRSLFRFLLRLREQGWIKVSATHATWTQAATREAVISLSRRTDQVRQLHLACANHLLQSSGEGLIGWHERVGRHLVYCGQIAKGFAHLEHALDERQRLVGPASALGIVHLCEEVLNLAHIENNDPRWGTVRLYRARLLFEGREVDGAWTETDELWQDALEYKWTHIRYPVLILRRELAEELALDLVLRESITILNAELPDITDLVLRGEVCETLGRHFTHLGDLQNLRLVYHAAQHTYEKKKMPLRVARVQLALATAEAKLGDLSLADALFKKAWRQGETLGRVHLSKCLCGMGEVARRQRHYDQASVWFDQALETAEPLGAAHANHPRIQLGILEVRRRHYAEGRVHLEQALLELEHADDLRNLTKVRLMLLPCLAHDGDWNTWDQHLDLALEWVDELNIVGDDVVDAAQRAAEIAQKKGEPARAKKALRLALKQVRGMGDLFGSLRLQKQLQGDEPAR